MVVGVSGQHPVGLSLRWWGFKRASILLTCWPKFGATRDMDSHEADVTKSSTCWHRSRGVFNLTQGTRQSAAIKWLEMTLKWYPTACFVPHASSFSAGTRPLYQTATWSRLELCRASAVTSRNGCRRSTLCLRRVSFLPLCNGDFHGFSYRLSQSTFKVCIEFLPG